MDERKNGRTKRKQGNKENGQAQTKDSRGNPLPRRRTSPNAFIELS